MKLGGATESSGVDWESSAIRTPCSAPSSLSRLYDYRARCAHSGESGLILRSNSTHSGGEILIGVPHRVAGVGVGDDARFGVYDAAGLGVDELTVGIGVKTRLRVDLCAAGS